MRLLIFILILGGFFGAYFYLGHPVLHAIRIFSPLLLLIYVTQRVQLTRDALILGAFYTTYFFYTLGLSLVYIWALEINDIINFIVLYFFVLAITISVAIDESSYQQIFKLCIWIYILASLPVWAYELITHRHLIYSVAADFAPDYYFQPTTGFFVNANDFAAITALSVMFLLGGMKIKGIKNIILSVFLILFSTSVSYTASSRISFLALVIFLFFYYKVWRFKGILIYLLLISLAGYLVVYFNLETLGLTDFSIGESESISQRIELYYHGFISVFYNYGFGYGILGHHYYYKEIAHLTLTDPHNYILELWIDSGVIITILYLLLLVYLFLKLIRRKDKMLLVQFLLYNFMLLSSSSSSFLWPHYLFFIAYFFQNEVEPET